MQVRLFGPIGATFSIEHPYLLPILEPEYLQPLQFDGANDGTKRTGWVRMQVE